MLWLPEAVVVVVGVLCSEPTTPVLGVVHPDTTAVTVVGCSLRSYMMLLVSDDKLINGKQYVFLRYNQPSDSKESEVGLIPKIVSISQKYSQLSYHYR